MYCQANHYRPRAQSDNILYSSGEGKDSNAASEISSIPRCGGSIGCTSTSESSDDEVPAKGGKWRTRFMVKAVRAGVAMVVVVLVFIVVAVVIVVVVVMA